ncbi:MAG: c-type cytochrome [Pseudomonadota bacterium]
MRIARTLLHILFVVPLIVSAADGETIWEANCKGCHGYGIAGAPLAGDRKAWAPRIAKGKNTLYEHAINGHFGKRGTMMPARGGNSELTDDQVIAAVDHMVSMAVVKPDESADENVGTTKEKKR